MPYRLLCNDVQREGIKPSPDLASGLFFYAQLHNIWYGITKPPQPPKTAGAGATKTALSGLLHDRSEKKDISARFLCGVH